MANTHQLIGHRINFEKMQNFVWHNPEAEHTDSFISIMAAFSSIRHRVLEIELNDEMCSFLVSQEMAEQYFYELPISPTHA